MNTCEVNVKIENEQQFQQQSYQDKERDQLSNLQQTVDLQKSRDESKDEPQDKLQDDLQRPPNDLKMPKQNDQQNQHEDLNQHDQHDQETAPNKKQFSFIEKQLNQILERLVSLRKTDGLEFVLASRDSKHSNIKILHSKFITKNQRQKLIEIMKDYSSSDTQPTPPQTNSSQSTSTINENICAIKPTVKTFDLIKLSNVKNGDFQLTQKYQSLFVSLTQHVCKTIAKEWIKVAEPKKQALHPYKLGNHSKPNWWPKQVNHIEPDHLDRDGRLLLLIALIRNPNFDLQIFRNRTKIQVIDKKITGKIIDEIYYLAVYDRLFFNKLNRNENQLALINLLPISEFKKISNSEIHIMSSKINMASQIQESFLNDETFLISTEINSFSNNQLKTWYPTLKSKATRQTGSKLKKVIQVHSSKNTKNSKGKRVKVNEKLNHTKNKVSKKQKITTSSNRRTKSDDNILLSNNEKKSIPINKDKITIADLTPRRTRSISKTSDKIKLEDILSSSESNNNVIEAEKLNGMKFTRNVQSANLHKQASKLPLSSSLIHRQTQSSPNVQDIGEINKALGLLYKNEDHYSNSLILSDSNHSDSECSSNSSDYDDNNEDSNLEDTDSLMISHGQRIDRLIAGYSSSLGSEDEDGDLMLLDN